MAAETDVCQVASIIAEQFGREGVDWAARQAHSFQIGGKTDSYNVWVSIMEKVDQLTSQEQNSATAQ